jgi:hypothetical protein
MKEYGTCVIKKRKKKPFMMREGENEITKKDK